MAKVVHLLVTDPAPGLRVISFNKNAINPATYIGLRQALDAAISDEAIDVIALTGVCESFSSSNDLNSRAGFDDLETYMDVGILVVRRLVQSFVGCPKFLVAVVNGPAIGIAATVVALFVRAAFARGFVSEVFDAGELLSKLWPRLENLPELAQQSLRAMERLMRQRNNMKLFGTVEQKMTGLRERMQSEAMTAVMQFMSRSRKAAKAKL